MATWSQAVSENVVANLIASVLVTAGEMTWRYYRGVSGDWVASAAFCLTLLAINILAWWRHRHAVAPTPTIPIPALGRLQIIANLSGGRTVLTAGDGRIAEFDAAASEYFNARSDSEQAEIYRNIRASTREQYGERDLVRIVQSGEVIRQEPIFVAIGERVSFWSRSSFGSLPQPMRQTLMNTSIELRAWARSTSPSELFSNCVNLINEACEIMGDHMLHHHPFDPSMAGRITVVAAGSREAKPAKYEVRALVNWPINAATFTKSWTS